MIIISSNQSNNQKKIIQTPVEHLFRPAEKLEGSTQVQKPSNQKTNTFVRKIIEKECINHFLSDTTSDRCDISVVKSTLSKNYAASLEFIEGRSIFKEDLITKDKFINYLAENIQNRIEILQSERQIKSRLTTSGVYLVAQDIISHTLNRTGRRTDDILTSPGSNTAINGTESECFTLPSSKHSDNNQDRIKVISRDDISIIMVCDGVSGSGDKTVQGTQTGGGAAAEKSLNIIEHLFEPIKESIITSINQCTNIFYDGSCTLEELNDSIKEILKEFCTTKFMDIVENQTDLKDTDGATTMELCLKLSIRNVPFIITLSIGDSETIIQFDDQSLIQLNADVIKGHRESNETNTPNIYNIDDLKEIQKKHKPYSNPIAHVNKDNYPIPTISYCWGQDVKRIISFTDGISDGISTINDNGACLDNELMETLLNFCDLTKMSNKEICRFLNAVAMCISKKEDDVTIGMLDGPLMRG